MAYTVTENYYTYDEIDNLADGLYEIIDGIKVDVSPTGFKHAIIAGKIYRFLYDRLAKQGFLAIGEVGILISRSPLRIRGADILFISHDKLKKEPSGVLEIPPDVVIEIISPSNTQSEIDEKIRDYLKIGVEKIITIYHEVREVVVYTSRGEESYSYDYVVEVWENVHMRFSEVL